MRLMKQIPSSKNCAHKQATSSNKFENTNKTISMKPHLSLNFNDKTLKSTVKLKV